MLGWKARETLLYRVIRNGSSKLRDWDLELNSKDFRVYHFGTLIGGYNTVKREFFSTHEGWSTTDRDNLRAFLYYLEPIWGRKLPSLSNVRMYFSNGMFGLPFLAFEAKAEDELYYIDGVYGEQSPRPESYVVLSCPRMTTKEVQSWGGCCYYWNKKRDGEAYFPQLLLSNSDFIKRVLRLQINHYKNFDRGLYNYLNPKDIDDDFQCFMDLNSLKYGWEVKTA